MFKRVSDRESVYVDGICHDLLCWCFVFQAEDGIRDLVRSRGLGDVYKRQHQRRKPGIAETDRVLRHDAEHRQHPDDREECPSPCLLYTSDAADERSSVDLGGRRIIKKKTTATHSYPTTCSNNHIKHHVQHPVNQKTIYPKRETYTIR